MSSCVLDNLSWTETFLATKSNPSIQAGVAEWLSRWPRDPSLHKKGRAKMGKPASGPWLAGVRIPSPAPSGYYTYTTLQNQLS
jgi:hypothetical protein